MLNKKSNIDALFITPLEVKKKHNTSIDWANLLENSVFLQS